MKAKTKNYIETWKNKIAEYKDDSLITLFDKYTALYTLYNRLFNESYQDLESNKNLEKPRYSDFEKATKLVIQYNGANNIFIQLEEQDCIKDVNAISNLIKNNVFHINLEDGVPREDFDLQLAQNMENDDVNLKVQAILSTIYNVRCNMQHGEKHFQEQQRLLLEPLIRILQSITELQILKLQ
ncbi:hypothetical protein LNQ81_14355 [Myroides sp. M-43]|uniref:hypothetical protein n=1 Tax=Myroides oncorhynchi TaxID=2893756 RepID=UPI001E3F1FEE|nr:hypothetical protein [Myroides oncorhynchi]MCC9043858.1 hypothetical protein [Myroides oncorhynchi]